MRSIFLLLLFTGALRVTAQTTGPLERFTPVTGQIESGGVETWTLNAAEGEMLSFVVEASSGNLDPTLTIVNSGGQVIVANDDAAYPDNPQAVIEAITVPRADTYSVIVNGFGATAGDYMLTVLAGYGQIAASSTFDDRSEWQSSGSPLISEVNNGRMALTLSGNQQRGAAFFTGGVPTAYYARINVAEVSGPDGWAVGMLARRQDSGAYYAFEVNQRGEWRFVARQGANERVLRDWTAHPAIIAGTERFSLSLLVIGDGFDCFYNDQLVGYISDDALPLGGAVGVTIGTGAALDSEVSAVFDDLTITAPLEVENRPVHPQRLIVSSGTAMAQELRRRLLIPPSGQMGLTIPESFVESNRPGVNEILLGGGQEFSNFAIGASFTWNILGDGAVGCGLLLRAANETDYTLAYLDQTGGFGISRRRGDAFTSGLFGVLPSLNGATHHLLIVARDNIMAYYIDGVYVGQQEDEQRPGMIGNAVVNFEPVTTSCQFGNTWLWQW